MDNLWQRIQNEKINTQKQTKLRRIWGLFKFFGNGACDGATSLLAICELMADSGISSPPEFIDSHGLGGDSIISQHKTTKRFAKPNIQWNADATMQKHSQVSVSNILIDMIQ